MGTFLEKIFCISTWLVVKSSCKQNPKAKLCQLCSENSKVTKVHLAYNFPNTQNIQTPSVQLDLKILPNPLHKYFNMESHTSCLASTLPQSACTDTLTILLQTGTQHQGWGRESETLSQGSLGIKAPKGLDCISLRKAYDAHCSLPSYPRVPFLSI